MHLILHLNLLRLLLSFLQFLKQSRRRTIRAITTTMEIITTTTAIIATATSPGIGVSTIGISTLKS